MKTYIVPGMIVININFKQALLNSSPNGQNIVDPNATHVSANEIEGRSGWFDEGEE